MFPVPFIDLKRLAHSVRGEVVPAWEALLEASDFVGGPPVSAFEERLAKALHVPHVVSCANGTDAVTIALYAAGVRPGDRVAMPNLTFWASYEAIVRVGAIAVLVDIDPGDLQMSFEELASAHAKHRFRAAVFVHLYGWTSARLTKLRVFCHERDIALVEDGAQCMGACKDGEPVLKGATFGALSFYPTKVLGGAMDGGAITVQNAEHAELVRSLCNHGRVGHYTHAHAGWNSRMSNLQAVYLNAVLARLDSIVKARRHHAEVYRSALGPQSGVSDAVKTFGPPAGVEENGYLNVITVPNVDVVTDYLAEKRIGFGRTYPLTIADQPPAKGVAIEHGELKVSRAHCKSVLNLPLFFGITGEEQRRAIVAIHEAVR